MKDSIDILQQQIKHQSRTKKKLSNELESIKQTLEHQQKSEKSYESQFEVKSHSQVEPHLELEPKEGNDVIDDINLRESSNVYGKNRQEVNYGSEKGEVKQRQENGVNISLKQNENSKIYLSVGSVERQDHQHLNSTPFFGDKPEASKLIKIQQQNRGNQIEKINIESRIQEESSGKEGQNSIQEKQERNQFMGEDNCQQLKIAINGIKSKTVSNDQIPSFRRIKKDEELGKGKSQEENQEEKLGVELKQQNMGMNQQKENSNVQERHNIDKEQEQNKQMVVSYLMQYLQLDKILSVISINGTQAILDLQHCIKNIDQIQLQQNKINEAKENNQTLTNFQQKINPSQSQNPMNNFIIKLESVSKTVGKRQQEEIFIELKTLSPSKQSEENSTSKKQDRINSAVVSQGMSSAQSQRHREQVSQKSSQIVDESFHLDLTAKSRNSQNPYKIHKMDSLAYSIQNGFGYYPSSPDRGERRQISRGGNSNSNKSVLQKMDDIVGLQCDEQQEEVSQTEQKKSGRRIHKSLSHDSQENADFKNFRMMSIQPMEGQHEEQNGGVEQKGNRYEVQTKQQINDDDDDEQQHEYQQQREKKKGDNENDEKNDGQNIIKVPQLHIENQQNNQITNENEKQLINIQFQEEEESLPKTVNFRQGQLNSWNNDDEQIQSSRNKKIKKNIQSQKQQQQQQQKQVNKQESKTEEVPQKKMQNSKFHHYKSYEKIKKNIPNKLTSQNNKIPNDNELLPNKIQNFDADDQQGQQLDTQFQQKNKRGSQVVRRKLEDISQLSLKKKKEKQQILKKNSGPQFNLVCLEKIQNNENYENNNSSSVISIKSNKFQQILPNINIFSTEINNYQNKINRMKQQKQTKKRKLEQQLAKINHQIKILNKKQQQLNNQSSSNPKNQYLSRIKMTDNPLLPTQHQKKAKSLAKNLISQKRNRNILKLNQYKNIQKNINQYIDQLTNLRIKNQDRLKQKKRIEILERMKQKQVRKVHQKKKIQENQKFVIYLKSNGNYMGGGELHHEMSKRSQEEIHEEGTDENQILQEEFKELTPNLNQKKANLKKVRGLSVKKHKQDIYEKVLS